MRRHRGAHCARPTALCLNVQRALYAHACRPTARRCCHWRAPEGGGGGSTACPRWFAVLAGEPPSACPRRKTRLDPTDACLHGARGRGPPTADDLWAEEPRATRWARPGVGRGPTRVRRRIHPAAASQNGPTQCRERSRGGMVGTPQQQPTALSERNKKNKQQLHPVRCSAISDGTRTKRAGFPIEADTARQSSGGGRATVHRRCHHTGAVIRPSPPFRPRSAAAGVSTPGWPCYPPASPITRHRRSTKNAAAATSPTGEGHPPKPATHWNSNTNTVAIQARLANSRVK